MCQCHTTYSVGAGFNSARQPVRPIRAEQSPAPTVIAFICWILRIICQFANAMWYTAQPIGILAYYQIASLFPRFELKRNTEWTEKWKDTELIFLDTDFTNYTVRHIIIIVYLILKWGFLADPIGNLLLYLFAPCTCFQDCRSSWQWQEKGSNGRRN